MLDTESGVGRFLTGFRCFRSKPSNFVYSQLAQNEKDLDHEFTTDGKGVSLSSQIKRGNFALEDSDEDDDILFKPK